MIHFNGAFARAFPERVAANRERIERREAVAKAHDPFGGALDDIAEAEARGQQAVTRALRNPMHPMPVDDDPDGLSKNVHHSFKAGDRITVNSPGHHAHGHAGKIVDDRSDSQLEVKLDSGHTIHCAGSDLVPEDFPDPVETIANALKRGETVTAGTRLQKTFESYPNIQKFVSNGQIRFQDRDKIFG
jgi:hypothetical protein